MNISVCIKCAILLITFIFLSGCAMLNQFNPDFGADIIRINMNNEQTGPSNVLIIEGIETMPHSPILPDQEITLSILLKNMNEDKVIDKIRVRLFDAPDFKNINRNECNLIKNNCVPINGECSDIDEKLFCKLEPGSEKTVEFRLIAPAKEDILKSKTIPTLSYSVIYDFETVSKFTVPIVSTDEIIKRQSSGQVLTLTNSIVSSSGPVQVEAYIQGPQYLLGGNEATVYFIIRNTGNGELRYSQIDPGNLVITFPSELLQEQGYNLGGSEVFVNYQKNEQWCTSFHSSCLENTGAEVECYDGHKACDSCTVKEWSDGDMTHPKVCTQANKCDPNSVLENQKCANGLTCCVPKKDVETGRRMYTNPYFVCKYDKDEVNENEGISTCKNFGPLDLYKGISSPLYFTIKDIPYVDVFKSAQIGIKLNYEYELRGSNQVEVKAFGS